ncbi:hypothetical protein BDW74DRAFT_146835 [Aspergillus multicolor]|uniref:uncharacterized protein n=1 Tax=Aspergillus multicolor TaxID=41759 RepID=UPI003CCCE3A9
MVACKVYPGYSECYEIRTYGGRGAACRGVDASQHAILYMRGTRPFQGSQEPRMAMEPLEVVPDSPDEWLHPMSRLNFQKLYTVDHNVKIRPIGRIASGSQVRFRQYASHQ